MNEFQCCICGKFNPEQKNQHREMMFCVQCGSNARFRGLVFGLMRHVLNTQSSALVDIEVNREISGVGISDSEAYANILTLKLSYMNTYYHQEPYLDICNIDSASKYRQLDFIICSDVLEHTLEKPQAVLRNISGMLKQGGVAIISAPTYYLDSSLEWYPDASAVNVRQVEGRYEAFWTTTYGKSFVHLNPNFHGGPGSTLEMRLIAHNDLLRAGEAEGFAAETLDFRPKFGYSWPIISEYPGVDAPMDGRVIVFRKVTRA
jgi:SAM-dependent methyltransferase